MLALNPQNSNVRTNVFMYLKEAISKRLKASKYNKVEYWPLIINKAKEKKYVFCTYQWQKNKEEIRSVMKWTDTSFVYTYIEWNNIFELQSKTSKESKFHWLQFQILHKGCQRMDFLFKLKLIDLPAYSFYN